MSWLLGAYLDRRTYGSLAYSLLGLPIGIFGFTVVVSGFVLGVGLSIILVGIPILAATLLFVKAEAALERHLAWSLLDASMPRRLPTEPTAQGLFWPRLRTLVTGPRTRWKLGFIILRLPLGILGFTIAVTIIGLMIGGFAMPIVIAAGVEDQIGSWTIDTLPESFIYLPISLLFLLVGPRILLGWGEISGRISTFFLGVVEPAETKRAVIESLARTGEADAFAILEEVQLRLGRGPFVTSTRVEAALRALESTGQVQTQRESTKPVYSLRDNTRLERR